MSAVHRVEISGELTIHTAGERKAVFLEALEAAERAGAAEVEFDLAAVSELDTAGLQLLLMAQREAAQLGRSLRLAAVSQAVTDVLAIARLSADLDERSAPGSSSAAPSIEVEETAP